MTPTLTIAVVAAAIILLLAVTSPLLSPLFLHPSQLSSLPSKKGEAGGEAPPPLSLVIVPGHSKQALRSLLQTLLQQDYPAETQLIIVTEKGDADTHEAIAPFTADKRVYVTSVPESSRYVSRRKLAVTLGVKAARHEWILLTDATCQPQGSQWLRSLAEHLTPTNDLALVMGLPTESSSFQNFRHHFITCSILRSAKPWRTITHFIAFRKSQFLTCQGYRDDLQYTAGEYDFLVNRFAQPFGKFGKFVVPSLIQETLSPRQRRNNQLQYLSIRHHLPHAAAARRRFNVYAAAMFLSDITILAGLVTPLSSLIPQPASTITCAAAAVAAVTGYAIRTYIARRSMSLIPSGGVGGRLHPFLSPIYERWQPLYQLLWLIRYWHSDKSDYTTHKL